MQTAMKNTRLEIVRKKKAAGVVAPGPPFDFKPITNYVNLFYIRMYQGVFFSTSSL